MPFLSVRKVCCLRDTTAFLLRFQAQILIGICPKISVCQANENLWRFLAQLSTGVAKYDLQLRKK